MDEMKKSIVVVFFAFLIAGCGSKISQINESFDPARTVITGVGDFEITVKPLSRSVKEEKMEDKTMTTVTYEGTGWEKNPIGSRVYTVLYVSITKKTVLGKGGKIELMHATLCKETAEDEFEPVLKTGLSLGEGDKTMVTLKNRAEQMSFDKGAVDGIIVFPNFHKYEGKVGFKLPFKYFGQEKGGKGNVFELRMTLDIKQEF